jgi:predicted amino acid-binding ACT domain protein
MTLVDFGRMEAGKIKISPRIGTPLGLVDGSEVFSSMFRYEAGDKGTFEIVLSPFGPENYREIAYVTIHVRDEPGALAQAAQFLKTRNIDILNSETVSSIPNIIMVWEMLVDLSFFGDSLTLKKEFDEAKHSRDQALSMVDCLAVEASDLATRYTKGAATGCSNVKTMAMRKTEKKASTITGGVFELPNAYVNFLGKDSGPVMFVAEPESWIMSVVFLNDDSRLHKVRIDLPDRPGAIHEIMKVLGDMSVNVISGWTNVLVYYEKMTAELVVDVRGSKAKSGAELQAALKEKVSALGPQFSLAEVSPIAL